MKIEISSPILLIIQLALLVLHYGNSTLLGITWSDLPWFVVWLPALLVLLVFVVFGLVALMAVIAAILFG